MPPSNDFRSPEGVGDLLVLGIELHVLGTYRGHRWEDLEERTQVEIAAYQRLRHASGAMAAPHADRPVTDEDLRWMLTAPLSMGDLAYIEALKAGTVKRRAPPASAGLLQSMGIDAESAEWMATEGQKASSR